MVSEYKARVFFFFNIKKKIKFAAKSFRFNFLEILFLLHNIFHSDFRLFDKLMSVCVYVNVEK